MKNYLTTQKLHVVTENQKTNPHENTVLLYKEVSNILENSEQSISNKSKGTEVLSTELLNIMKLDLS